MRRWLGVVLLAGAMLFPSSVGAQAPISLSGVLVQLWPEYDQPSMLVIYDFQVAEGTQLPVGVTLRFPKDANLIAVAVHQDTDTLLNADYRESTSDEQWQSVIVQVQTPATHRIEYFQPLSRSGDRRTFSYTWPADYAVESFNLTLRMPADAVVSFVVPELQRGENDGATYFMGNDFGTLRAGEEFNFKLDYTRTTDALVAPPESLQPSQQLDGSTPGRVMLSNYLPYALGALGILLVVGGGIYFWQSNRAGAPREKHRQTRAPSAAGRPGDVYCPQCGTRAEPGDRFCRVCGTRLTPPQ